MKPLLLFLLSISTLMANAQEDIRNYALIYAGNLETINLNGNVEYINCKSFDADKFEFKDSIIKENKPHTFSHERTYFDSIGRLKRRINFSHPFAIEVIYDSQNRLSKHLSIDIETFKVEKIVETIEWSETDSTLFSSLSVHDSLYATYKPSTMFYLDKHQNVTLVKTFSSGILESTYEFYYDTLNQIIHSVWFGPNQTVNHEWTYEYDTHGNLIKRIKTNGKGGINTSRVFEYDSYNNLILDKSNRGATFSWEYEYDEKKNWIKSITKRNGEQTQITIRKIKYY